MNIINKIQFAIIALLLIPLPLLAQIKGKVQTTDKSPVIGAYIHWQGTNIGTTTNSEGFFSIPATELSDTLLISSVEYATVKQYVSKNETDLTITLSEIYDLEGVTVTAGKKSTLNDRISVQSIQKITSSELKRAACCNLSESFETNPSVDVSYSDAATGAKQIKLLGLSGLYVQFMTEQAPNLKGIATPYGLGYIPGPFMESIQITKGAGSVVNGYEAITGQINVEYKKPQNADKLSVNLFASDAGRVEANADGVFKINDYLYTGVLLHASDELLEQDRNSDNFHDMPMVRQFNGINRWYYKRDNFISQLLLHGISERRMGGQLNGDYHIHINTKRYDAFWKNGYILNNDRDMSIGLILKGSWQELDARYGLRGYNGKQLSLYANLIFQTEIAPKHKISTGISANYDNFVENLTKVLFLQEYKNVGKQEFLSGVFAEYTYNLDDKFVLLAGIRGDYNAYFDKFVATPRLHLKYSPIYNINLRASVGKGYRSANIFAENNYMLASNRTFRTDFDYYLESAWNGGLSGMFHVPIARRELTLIAEYFYTRFGKQAVIDLDRDTHEVNIYALDGRSFSHNVQIEASMELFTGFSFTAAHRITDVRQSVSGVLSEKPFTSRWKSLLTMSYFTKFRKWQFDYTIQANGGGRLARPDNANPLWDKEFKPYLINNAQITRNFKNWSIYLGGENIFNYTQSNPIINVANPFSANFDATMIYAPTHGRKIYAGFRWNL